MAPIGAELRHALYDWGGLNASMFLWVNGAATPALLALAKLASAIGSYWGAPALFAILAAVRHRRAEDPEAALAPARFLLAVVLALAAAALAKHALALPRPEVALGAAARVAGPPDSRHSFPSGHATYAGAALAILWPLARWPVRAALCSLALALGWSRLALGAHFPADVVGGFLLGVGCALLARAAVEGARGRARLAARRARDAGC